LVKIGIGADVLGNTGDDFNSLMKVSESISVSSR
jgi:hypothetical protein